MHGHDHQRPWSGLRSCLVSHLRRLQGYLSLLGLVALLSPALAAAEDFGDALGQALEDTTFDANLRGYAYQRWHDANGPVGFKNQQALGGDAHLLSGSLYGFSAGMGFYTENAFLPPDYDHVNSGLLGPDEQNLTALAESYLQYQQGEALRLRGGRQLLDTPYANADMYTMMPRAFQGVGTRLEPLRLRGTEQNQPKKAPGDWASPSPQLVVEMHRMWDYESRFDDAFRCGNEYLDRRCEGGFWTTGATYDQQFLAGGLKAQAWYYQFYDYAELGYLELGYQAPEQLFGALRPFVKGQAALEGNSGKRVLGRVDSQIYGLKLGVGFDRGELALLWNHAPVHHGAFRHGGQVHPYNDLSGTEYTDTMNDGLSNLGPGDAYGAKGQLDFLQGRLKTFASYVWYNAEYGTSGAFYGVAHPYGFAVPENELVRDQHSHGTDVGFDLDIGGFITALKGLKLFNYVGIRRFEGVENTFVENRFGLVYAF